MTMLRFGLVGLSGLVINQVVFTILTEPLRLNLALAAVLATQISTVWNFAGIELWAFRGRSRSRSLLTRFLGYAAINDATLILRVPALGLLVLFGLGSFWANLITLIGLFVIRFVISDGLIWSSARTAAYLDPEGDLAAEDAAHETAAAEGAAEAGRHLYDVAGLVRLDSDVELPELAFFRAARLTERPDIRIRIGAVGSLPRPNVELRRVGEQLIYREHLGVLGANFSVEMGQPIEIRVTPLLALSRHVLYTNVVEALLRFVLVSKDHVLLHAACVAVEGRAVLLSAQTDTGKTSTIIELVRSRGYGFLSDDMTIIEPTGYARRYPKPMTLSFHTMSAIKADDIPARQRMQLQVQSRVHSKSGRSIGRTLGSFNIPIVSVNSVVQLVVPPPKYHIDDLIPCEIVERAPIGDIFLMERGPWLEEPVPATEAVTELLANTDDAYGFPPFDRFSPQIRIGEADHAALREREKELLARAIERATVRRLRVPGHEWAQLLPQLLETASDERQRVPITIQPDAPVAIPVVTSAPGMVEGYVRSDTVA